jgi:glycolate oxidase FAD binding subunit
VIAPSRYLLGEREPGRIVEAADAREVAAVLAEASARGEAVVAFGGGTLQGIGNPPSRYDVALDLRALRALQAYDHRDLTIGVDAGMTVEQVTRILDERGQFVPLDVPEPATATIGGVLAAGWLGPRRAAYGRPRDLLIGTVAALADGSLAHAGGMVVKNVTGYDVGKLYVGSLGTLAILVRANFKALPRPAARRLALAPLAEDVRDRAVAAIASLALEPVAALAIDGFGAAARLVVLHEGSEATVDRATRELRSALGRAGVAETTLVDGARAPLGFARALARYTEVGGERTITYREPGLPSSAWERAQRALAAGAETIADLRTGDVIARVSSRRIDVRAVLPRAIVIAGAPALRARLDAWGPPPATLATMRALKERFDPQGLLAPGRFVGGL